MNKWQRGFSLIEILVVLLIIAFSSQLVVYAVSDNAEEELEQRVLKLHAVINFASEYAVMNQQELGLYFNKDTKGTVQVELLRYDGKKWVELSGIQWSKPISFDEDYKVEWIINDLPWSQDNLLAAIDWQALIGSDDDDLLELEKIKIPQVMLLSSGELSPFILELELAKEPEVKFIMEGKYIAPVLLKREPE